MNRLVSLLMLICLTSFVYAGGPGQGAAVRVLVIDPGHGGMDPGAIGPGGHHEADLALAVSLKFGEMVKEAFPDVKIIYTRTTDKFVSLADRADMANKAKADLFICIHLNSATNHDAYGTSTYVLGLHRTDDNLEIAKRENAVIDLEVNKDKKYEFDPNSPEGHIIMSMKQNAFLDQSILIASKIEDELAVLSKRKSRGVKQAGFWVLYKTAMPSLLAEIGFISNPTEEQYLSTDNGQTNIATSVFKAFRAYKNEIEGRKDTDIVIAKAPTAEKKKEVPAEASQPIAQSDPASPGKQPQDPQAPKQADPKPQQPPTTNLNPRQAKKEEKAWEPDTTLMSGPKTPPVRTEKPTIKEDAPPVVQTAVKDTTQPKVKAAATETMTKKIVPLRTGNEPTTAPVKKEEPKAVAPSKPAEPKAPTASQKAKADSVKTAALKAERILAQKARTDSIRAVRTAAILKTRTDSINTAAAKKEAAAAKAATLKADRAAALKARTDSIKEATDRAATLKAERVAAWKAKADSIKTAAAHPAVKKQPVTAKAPKETPAATATKAADGTERVLFTVQILAAHKAPKNYNELVDIFGLINREDIDDGVVRYMAGQYTHYKDAQKTLDLAKEKGFTGAFIICYLNDVRQDVKKSRELGLKYP